MFTPVLPPLEHHSFGWVLRGFSASISTHPGEVFHLIRFERMQTQALTWDYLPFGCERSMVGKPRWQFLEMGSESSAVTLLGLTSLPWSWQGSQADPSGERTAGSLQLTAKRDIRRCHHKKDLWRPQFCQGPLWPLVLSRSRFPSTHH